MNVKEEPVLVIFLGQFSANELGLFLVVCLAVRGLLDDWTFVIVSLFVVSNVMYLQTCSISSRRNQLSPESVGRPERSREW